VLAEMTNPDNGQYSFARPVQMIDPSGGQLTFVYGTSGQLLSMTDSYGRAVTFDWALAAGKIAAISTANLPDGNKLKYFYESADGSTLSLYPDRLIRVELQDASAVVLDQTSYQYGDGRSPTSVTAILDKNGVTRWTATYDDRGRAVSSSGPSGVDATTIAYGPEGTTTTRTVTNALGKSTVYTFSRSSLSVYDLKLVSVDGQASTNCPSTSASTTYGSDNFIATQTDEEGRVTAYTRNSRGLPTQTTEAQGTSNARTTSTTWHADMSEPTQTVEPGLTTDFVYDNQSVP
jgi:YD repeat-containing protein